ncbi:MAG: hypothetical protein WEB00_11460 [Dehalococcoidia bacterium]
MPENETRDLQPDPIVRDFIAEVAGGEHWARALLRAAAAWQRSEEVVGDRHYRYLIGGEAFDWAVLAERLLAEVVDFIPDKDRVALLFEGRWPDEFSEEDLKTALGPARYAAHLNFRYGVVVEEALQLAFEQEVQKEKSSHVWGDEVPLSDTERAIQRLYGATSAQLMREFMTERPEIILPSDAMGLGDLKEFTYWLFRYRVKMADPARVASDTRKGLALLSRMEMEVRPRRRLLEGDVEPAQFLETSGWFAHSRS